MPSRAISPCEIPLDPMVLVYFGLSAWPCAAGGCLVARLPDGFEFPHLERASQLGVEICAPGAAI